MDLVTAGAAHSEAERGYWVRPVPRTRSDAGSPFTRMSAAACKQNESNPNPPVEGNEPRFLLICVEPCLYFAQFARSRNVLCSQEKKHRDQMRPGYLHEYRDPRISSSWTQGRSQSRSSRLRQLYTSQRGSVEA